MLDVARLWSEHRISLVADFRREYNLSWDDLARLSAVEFVQLTLGLSRRSRTVETLADPKAKQQKLNQKPHTREQYVQAARRLRGRVHFVSASGGPTV